MEDLCLTMDLYYVRLGVDILVSDHVRRYVLNR